MVLRRPMSGVVPGSSRSSYSLASLIRSISGRELVRTWGPQTETPLEVMQVVSPLLIIPWLFSKIVAVIQLIGQSWPWWV